VSTAPVDGPEKPLLRALAGERLERVPFWFMRQAGRYLPEYQALRARAGSFLDLCYSPELAAEATMQPFTRFGMDAVILFSDILVVPDALGQRVEFQEGEGPVLEALRPEAGISGLRSEGLRQRLAPVYQAVALVRDRIPPEIAVIGFAGAPWTVASYMIEGGGSRDFAAVKAWAYGDPASFGRLIELLVEATTEHLSAQIESGAEVVQLFDSWAGVLPEAAFRRWSIEPNAAIVAGLRKRHPKVPVMAFPRGAGVAYESFAKETGVDGLSLDTTVPPAWAAAVLQPLVTVQGNLDPMMLVTGGAAMLDEARGILEALAGGPFIFNLGHGVAMQTPPEHVAALSAFLKDWRVS